MKHPVPTVALFITMAVLAFLGRAIAQEKCVSVRITNCYARTVAIAYGPVTLCAETRVTPDERHRYLETVWDYAPPDALMPDLGMDEPEFGLDPDKQNGAIGSSVRSLDGELERIRQDVKLAGLSGGTYEVRSTVYSDESRRKICGTATARVMIK